MMAYRVQNTEGLVAKVKSAGVTVSGDTAAYRHG